MTSLPQNQMETIWDLLEAVCEERLTADQQQRLEQLVLNDAEARRTYIEYMALHGSLYWDAALSTEVLQVNDRVESSVSQVESSAMFNHSQTGESSGNTHWKIRGAFALAACLLVAIGAWAQHVFNSSASNNDPILTARTNPSPNSERLSSEESSSKNSASKSTPKNQNANSVRQPIAGSVIPNRKRKKPTHKSAQELPVVAQRPPEKPFIVPAGGSDLEIVVATINERLARQWDDHGVQPSPRADDAKWLRRVSLDIVGRIPTVAEIEQFLADSAPDKRRKAIDRLLSDPQYVRHWTTVWSNLLVGRKPSADVNRPALERFLRDSFFRNRPWKDVVIDLVSAEGNNQENGAANFLIAHLNNEAVPATAITARLFLGMQVQCTQCHNHPFNNWKQSQFWELNSFFQQTKTVKRKSKSKPRTVELVNRELGGPIYYATRSELLMAAFPKFEGQQIDPAPHVNRRAELARLLFESDQNLVARAMVNRMWAHFFGYGFTRRIDDMGPHSPPTHPELLERLTQEFVASGYDLKRLIRWICNSRAYQLSSQFNETNQEDNPANGVPPIFSRMYVKAMTAEQLYDSLLVATGVSRKNSLKHRREWLDQFFFSYETEENDEATTFDGTIPQALMLMNSELIQEAVSGRSGTYLQQVLSARGNDDLKINKLCLATLSRLPTKKERAFFRKALSASASRSSNRRLARAQTLQDIFWAFLNSNEFILVH